jgi:hypothetical protein
MRANNAFYVMCACACACAGVRVCVWGGGGSGDGTQDLALTRQVLPFSYTLSPGFYVLYVNYKRLLAVL